MMAAMNDAALRAAAERCVAQVDHHVDAWFDTRLSDEKKAWLRDLFATCIQDAFARHLSPPAGWRLVPEEPTQEQIGVEITPLLVAGSLESNRVRQWRDALYRKMVAAAPPPPPRDGEKG